MSEIMKSKGPMWFMVLSALLLGWNLMGVMAYLMQVTMTPEAIQALPEAQRQVLENTPAWVTAAFAIGVNGGALGCLLLLLRKNLAGLFLELSLAGVLVHMFYAFFMSNAFEAAEATSVIMPLMVTVLAVYQVVLAKQAKSRGWTT